MEQISLKHDQGKLRYSLIPAECLKAMAGVMTYGATKYQANTWQGVETERYMDALFRHVQAFRENESHDPESGIHHMAHVMVNAMFILFKDNHKIV